MVDLLVLALAVFTFGLGLRLWLTGGCQQGRITRRDCRQFERALADCDDIAAAARASQ